MAHGNKKKSKIRKGLFLAILAVAVVVVVVKVAQEAKNDWP